MGSSSWDFVLVAGALNQRPLVLVLVLMLMLALALAPAQVQTVALVQELPQQRWVLTVSLGWPSGWCEASDSMMRAAVGARVGGGRRRNHGGEHQGQGHQNGPLGG